MSDYAGTAEPLRQRFTTYAVYGFLVGIVFFTVYPSLNWLTSQRTSLFHLYLPIELSIPFLPGFIWFYLSMYLLFLLPPFLMRSEAMRLLAAELIILTLLAGVSFLLLPAQLGFDRVLPDSPLQRTLFEGLFTVDHPHNLVPSLHVAYSVSIMMALMRALPGCFRRALLGLWLALIMVSTVFIHQHHLLDVLSGFALSILIHLAVRKHNAKGDCTGSAAVQL